jgi:hypothetical protein
MKNYKTNKYNTLKMKDAKINYIQKNMVQMISKLTHVMGMIYGKGKPNSSLDVATISSIANVDQGTK